MRRLAKWEGASTSFSPVIPFATSGGKPGDGKTPTDIAVMMAEFTRHPLDYLYYPRPTAWDSGAGGFRPCKLADAKDVFLVADTFRLSLAELAIMGGSDYAAFHLAIQMAHFWRLGSLADAKEYPGIGAANRPNFSRVIGNTSALLRAVAPQHVRGQGNNVRSHTGQVAVSRATMKANQSWWKWALAAVGLGSGVAYYAKRK
jgi:hypothetical protein